MKLMKLAGGVLLAFGVTPFCQLASAQDPGGGPPPVSREALTSTRFAEEDVTDVGVGGVRPIGSEDNETEQDLVASLEAGGQTTGEINLFSLLFAAVTVTVSQSSYGHNA